MTETAYIKVKDPAVSTAIVEWWNGLENRRGDRAALRRCERPDEAFQVPAFHGLLAAVRLFGSVDPNRMARVACLLAQVTTPDESGEFAAQLARSSGEGNRPLVSESRFQRLLRVPNDDSDTLCTQLRRFVRHLGGTANLTDLAQVAYDWGEYQKRRMALAYFASTSVND